MTTPCWLVLVVVRLNAIPESLLLLPIPRNWILGDVEDATTNLNFLLSRKISPLMTAGNLSRRSHGQPRI
jgi:hypothetical protein